MSASPSESEASCKPDGAPFAVDDRVLISGPPGYNRPDKIGHISEVLARFVRLDNGQRFNRETGSEWGQTRTYGAGTRIRHLRPGDLERVERARVAARIVNGAYILARYSKFDPLKMTQLRSLESAIWNAIHDMKGEPNE